MNKQYNIETKTEYSRINKQNILENVYTIL